MRKNNTLSKYGLAESVYFFGKLLFLMSRRNIKAAAQAETADLISALSEAASSSSSSAPINATRGASMALHVKDSATHDS